MGTTLKDFNPNDQKIKMDNDHKDSIKSKPNGGEEDTYYDMPNMKVQVLNLTH